MELYLHSTLPAERRQTHDYKNLRFFFLMRCMDNASFVISFYVQAPQTQFCIYQQYTCIIFIAMKQKLRGKRLFVHTLVFPPNDILPIREQFNKGNCTLYLRNGLARACFRLIYSILFTSPSFRLLSIYVSHSISLSIYLSACLVNTTDIVWHGVTLYLLYKRF